MRWFGQHWGAPVCDQTERAVVPAGRICMFCERVIRETDCGFEMPVVSGTPQRPKVSVGVVHRACMLIHVGVPEKEAHGNDAMASLRALRKSARKAGFRA